MNTNKEPDSPELGRKLIGARPPPPKKKRSLFPKRLATKDADEGGSSSEPSQTPTLARDPNDATRQWLPETLETNEPATGPPSSIFTQSTFASPVLPSDRSGGRQSPAPFILSPRPIRAGSPAVLSSDAASGETGTPRGKAIRALHAQTSRAKLVSPPPISPALTHWSNIRTAFLTNASSRVTSPTPTESSFAASVKRPVPKPSRFARFALRNVAEDARDAERYEANQFHESIRNACWAARFTPSSQNPRMKWQSSDNHSQASIPTSAGFSTSTLHLPFVSASASASNLSLPLSSTAVDVPQVGKRRGARAPSPPAQGPPRVSLQPLHRTLLQYAAAAQQSPTRPWMTRLPMEEDILAVIAMPFLVDNGGSVHADLWTAVECFEIISRTWPAPDIEDALERLLWCCQAAVGAPKPVQDHLVSLVRALISPMSGALPACSPVLVKACLHGLFTLQAVLSPSPGVTDVIASVIRGQWASPDLSAFEDEYDHVKASQRDVPFVIALSAAEALVRSLEITSSPLHMWILSILPDYWPTFTSGFQSDLQSRMYCRIAVTFSRAAMYPLQRSQDSTSSRSSTVQSVLDLCMTRVLPYLRYRRWAELEVCKNLAAVLLEVLCRGSTEERAHGWTMIEEMWRAAGDASESIITELRHLTTTAPLKEIVAKLSALLQGGGTEDVVAGTFAHAIPVLFQRLASELPNPEPALGQLLSQLSEKFPQHYHKPLFTCAGSVKDDVIAAQLVTLTAVARVTPNYWISNAEMIAVAVMGDVGSGLGKGKLKEGTSVKWGRTRIGQCVVILELLGVIQRMCDDSSEGAQSGDRVPSSTTRFMGELENRIAILLDAKEQATLLPQSQRVLLSSLLLSMRKLTRSLRPAVWLSRLSVWAREAYVGASATRAQFVSMDVEAFGNRVDASGLIVTEDVLNEVSSTLSTIDAIYGACQDLVKASKASRPLSMTLPVASQTDLRSLDGDRDARNPWSIVGAEKERVRMSIPQCVPAAFLSLLVAINGLLQLEDYRTIGPVIWDNYLDRGEAVLVGPASFLFMQYGERCPDQVVDLIGRDLASDDYERRQKAVLRLSILLSRRHQVLSQFHITDRTHRRPFKGVRQPISFVPTDIGSGQYVEVAEADDLESDAAVGVAQEVKKRLMELGWVDDDDPAGAEATMERMPISSIPSQLVNRLGHSTSSQPVQNASPATLSSPRPLLRRRSSGSNYYAGVKRRMIFVASIASCLPTLGTTASDVSPLVFGLAKEVLSTGMRDDGTLIGRPIMEDLSAHRDYADVAIRTMRALLFSQSALPPSFAHHVFNHLIGFLKGLARDTSNLDAFHIFSATLPLVSRLTVQVSDVLMRDLRRNKVEALLLPSGFLWFPASAPPGPMFPRSLPTFTDRAEGIALDQLKMLSIRTAQNMFVVQLLKRDPKDAYAVKKSLLPLELPTEPLPASLMQVPSEGLQSRRSLDYCSVTLGRSYLLAVVQVFRSLSRNLNDYTELARLITGVNSTVMAFRADLGIVTHGLISYIVASTRFRRLIASQDGFALFMPTVWLLYQASYRHGSIRVAVEHSLRFLYSVHDEAFIFQTLESLAGVLPTGNSDDDMKVGAVLYDMLHALDPSVVPRSDVAGLQDLYAEIGDAQGNLSNERSVPSGKVMHKGATNTSDSATVKAPAKRQKRPFPLEDLVRLCLTIIAHDVAAPRAVRFLRILRNLAPKLYDHSTGTRDVLRDGIDALGVVLTRNSNTRPITSGGIMDASSSAGKQPNEKDFPSAVPITNHVLILRREYLMLLTAYTDSGGTPPYASINKTLQLLRIVLKDSAERLASDVAKFIGHYSHACISRQSHLNRKQSLGVLNELSQLFLTYGASVDFSGVLQVVVAMLGDTSYTSDPAFAEIVVREWCRPALSICEAAAIEHTLWDLPLRKVTVSLLASVISLGNVDVFGLAELKEPSGALLAGVLVPLSLALANTSESPVNKTQENPDARCSQWLRLLSYILPACEPLNSSPSSDGRRRLRKSSPPRPLDRPYPEGQRDPLRRRLARPVFAMQILKIILLRGIDDLVRAPSSVWTLIASSLRDLLDDGNAEFVLSRPSAKDHSPESSRPASPSSSPKDNFLRPEMNILERSRSRSPEPPTGNPPRAVDFLMWTMMEILISHQTPLLLQLRLFVQEKVHHLNDRLRTDEQVAPRSPARTSVFVRSRSNSLSPDPSAVQAPRASFLKWSPGNTPTKSGGQSYFQLNVPPSPSPQRPNAPRIVHLGPLASSVSGKQPASVLGSQVLSAPMIRHSTKRSIQAVRLCMGYAPLALDGDSGQEDEGPWTRRSALARVIQETEALIQVEFGDEFMAVERIRTRSFSRPSVSPENEVRS